LPRLTRLRRPISSCKQRETAFASRDFGPKDTKPKGFASYIFADCFDHGEFMGIAASPLLNPTADTSQGVSRKLTAEALSRRA
jgi:hypothetical protein